jgi:hypothetical protein
MAATSPSLPRGPATGRAAFLAALLLLMAGCHLGTRPPPAPEAPPLPPDGGAFVVAESMLDTWNTIGQVLVGLDGVQYRGRAQMLGLYAVRYRGEDFLVRTQALPLESPGQGLRTRVDALGPTGGRLLDSAAAAELLGILAQRVPAEAARYRQPVRLRPGKPVRKKKRR